MNSHKSLGPVLITGASGFLGAWLTAGLVGRGETVHAFDISDDRSLLSELLGEEAAGGVGWTVGDVSDAAAIERAVATSRAHAIVHLAALTIPPCRSDPARGVAVNVLGHINVFDAARRHGIDNVLYTSSAAAHPRGPLHCPANIYGVTKRAVEDISKVYFLDHGLISIGLRPNVVYGYGRTMGETAAISEAIRAAAEGRAFVMPYASRMCFEYVGEVIEIMLRCLAAQPDRSVVSDISTEHLSVDDVIAAIRAVAPDARIEPADRDRPFTEVPLNRSELEALIGEWNGVSLEEGVRATFQQHRQRLEAAA